MSNEIEIVGYVHDTYCQHCGRKLKHGIRISDGRTVGATCLDKKITHPKMYQGQPYRVGSELIINAAKVVENKLESQWARYGVSRETLKFKLKETMP